MSSVCLYGGSFNPVHTAHLILAEIAREILNIPQITFVPSPTPPHKNHLLSWDIRNEMLGLAIKDNSSFTISDVEKERGGISYTIDTVRFFLNQSDTDRVYLLLGADSLLELPTWRSWQELLDLATIVVMGRPGRSFGSVNKAVLDKVIIIDTPMIDISATTIRKRVKEGRSIRYMVPEAVREYIEKHSIYQTE
jgi:nicotinate-nucleotide adenylyltransferase